MTRGAPTLRHEFVLPIPRELKPDTLYISVEYATAVHLCCCGCGREVVTPISPTGWSLLFDGATVSLDPSIGNWSYPCRSHYWIRRNRIIWAPGWSLDRIQASRAHDRAVREQYYPHADTGRDLAAPLGVRRHAWLESLTRWVRRK